MSDPEATVEAPAPATGVRARDAPLLRVEKITLLHGQLVAVREVSLELAAGEVLAVIGANGAGKSTLLRALAGLHRASAGSVVLDGEDVTRLDASQRVRRGIVLVPEGRRLFPSLTVEENILTGTYRARKGPWSLEQVYALFDWMPSRRHQRAVQLSGGEQQAVAIARALVANPRVLLLDELSLGLAPVVVQRIYGHLPAILKEGVAVLVVEQDVSQAMRVASRVQCLLEGRTTLEGRPGEVTTEEIDAAYFGLGQVVGADGAALVDGNGNGNGSAP